MTNSRLTETLHLRQRHSKLLKSRQSLRVRGTLRRNPIRQQCLIQRDRPNPITSLLGPIRLVMANIEGERRTRLSNHRHPERLLASGKPGSHGFFNLSRLYPLSNNLDEYRKRVAIRNAGPGAGLPKSGFKFHDGGVLYCFVQFTHPASESLAVIAE